MIQEKILEILKKNKQADNEEDEDQVAEDNEEDEDQVAEDNEEDEDLVKLIGLFLCNAVLFTTKEATKEADKLSEKYIGLVADPERSRNVSWPDLIHNFLEEQLNKCLVDDRIEHTNGCVTYLLIWFAEHTHIVKPVNLDNVKEYIPRAGRWNLMTICEELLKDLDTLEFEVKNTLSLI
ncbi:hypothetical protein MKW94_027365 [Papaver nudicaule]|uniref:Uncharacterized protein n=1 Tax=Papaver nudicaule TaxID=74823 RepID=A0AA41RTM8_PAPNU|nr:hypothetical protein [Papaver nudicaule]